MVRAVVQERTVDATHGAASAARALQPLRLREQVRIAERLGNDRLEGTLRKAGRRGPAAVLTEAARDAPALRSGSIGR